MGSAAPARRAPSWLALVLLPVVLPLVLLWLPLLCVAVAVVRFRRRRWRILRMSRCLGEGERVAEEGAGHRAALLQKYLEDQVRLVRVEDAAVDWRPSSCLQQGQAQRSRDAKVPGGRAPRSAAELEARPEDASAVACGKNWRR